MAVANVYHILRVYDITACFEYSIPCCVQCSRVLLCVKSERFIGTVLLWFSPFYFFKVNEEGSEAAAATAVVMNRRCMAMPNPVKPPEFLANHPFVFAIADMRNQAVLFIGKALSLV